MNPRPSRGLALALLVASIPACDQKTAQEITVLEGGAVTRFAVRTGFAEYIELPGERNELHLTLAGYAVSCERWAPPGDGEASVTVVVVTPPDMRPGPATYAWTGIPKPDEPLKATYALPKAQLGARSRLFEPGGSVRLTRVELDPHGTIRGTLAFEFPGDGERPATRVDGGFEAKVCRR